MSAPIITIEEIKGNLLYYHKILSQTVIKKKISINHDHIELKIPIKLGKCDYVPVIRTLSNTIVTNKL